MRDNFDKKVREILAKRAGYKCSICRAITIGPSFESILSISNIGVAAHITAASKGGPRYDPKMTPEKRSSIENGIWLCQTHAKMVDDDVITWKSPKLEELKREHEHFIKESLGYPIQIDLSSVEYGKNQKSKSLDVLEYAFLPLQNILKEYKEFIGPILRHNHLPDSSVLGVLVCVSGQSQNNNNDKVPCTLFVNDSWLKWYLEGKSSGYELDPKIPIKQILGLIPAWPDTFFEFLHAIIKTDTTFEWQQSKYGGYPQLIQKKKSTI